VTRSVQQPITKDVTSPQELVVVDDLHVRFPVSQGVVHAVRGVSFTIGRGETVALVGESGSGKSTTGFALIRRYTPAEGTISFEGRDITGVKGRELRRLRSDMQLVFQDPYASLNPRMRVRDLVAEPLLVHGRAKPGPALDAEVGDLLEMCGLPRDAAQRHPNAFSGGERQRIAIARALALRPKLLVADEVVSALDVSIKAQIINLLVELQRTHGLAYLFISHDLAVVRNVAHRVMIMYAGRIVETGPTGSIFTAPRHPYSVALLSAAPVADPVAERARERVVLTGDVPSVLDPPAGCPFHSRCPLVVDRCRVEAPPLADRGDGHLTACWRADEVAALPAAHTLDRAPEGHP